MNRFRYLAVALMAAAPFCSSQVNAAEGGYSNYIPGTYGDFAMALAPTEPWTIA